MPLTPAMCGAETGGCLVLTGCQPRSRFKERILSLASVHTYCTTPMHTQLHLTYITCIYYTQTQEHIQAYTCPPYTYACQHTHTYMGTHIHTRAYPHNHIFLHTCRHVCMQMCTQKNIHTKARQEV